MATITSTPSMTTTELEQQLVVFSLQGEHYALPITLVRKIIRYKPPRSIGQAYGLIQGVISVRGKILPICDLSSRLGTKAFAECAPRAPAVTRTARRVPRRAWNHRSAARGSLPSAADRQAAMDALEIED
jgi:chemotaxis signal transduction protein